jgi:hypothetical protein
MKKRKVKKKLARRRATYDTHIEYCTFHGSPSSDVCQAVTELAKAIQATAKALEGHPGLVLKDIGDKVAK